MKLESVLALHEKLYFHELDAREKLVQRLQLCLLVLSAIGSAWIYMLARIDFASTHPPFIHAIFLVTFLIASACVVASCYYFVRAFWGHRYECIPVAEEVEKYRSLLKQTYQPYQDGEATAAEYFGEFLIKYYSECAAQNAVTNSTRYDHIHESVSYIVYAIPFLFIAGLCFALGGIGKVAGS